ncbi:MAG TPA: hypothetical protein VME92_06750 [Acetobacteraceae bacterium]|nr:hypothetical protein [Acetobacteraceae bacterium]
MSSDDRSGVTRRIMMRAGAGLAAASAFAATAGAQNAPKIPKTAVLYQDHPKGDQKCSVCVNFEPPNACKIVAGDISPNGWCGAFAPKRA